MQVDRLPIGTNRPQAQPHSLHVRPTDAVDALRIDQVSTLVPAIAFAGLVRVML